MEIEVDGKTYVSEPCSIDMELDACMGCIAWGSSNDFCDSLNTEFCCVEHDVIWVVK
jgi:hypothetical protein